MPKFVERLLRAGEGRTVKRLENLAAQVNAIEEDFEALTDAELRAETDKFKARYADGQSLDQLLPKALARPCGKRPSGPSGRPTSTSSSWVAQHCISAMLPR